MRLEDMLKNVSGITNRVIKENCWDGQFNVLEGIQVLQSKINEIILAINNGIIKGDKGDTPNVQVGSTETLEPGNNASVTQTGDVLNPILNFSIPKGDKGDKGDTGKASESIQDNIVGLDTCWSSQKTVGYVDNMFNSLQDVKGVKYTSDKDYFVASGSKNGVVKDLKLCGKSLVNDGGIVNKEFTQFSVILNSKKMLTPNKEYTLIIENKTNADLIVYTAEEAIVPTQNINLKANSTTMKKIVSQSTVNSLRLLKSNTPNSNLFNLNVLLLEGDHTQSPPQYFEGIASVGNGNEIEVLSRKEDGNLFDGLTEKGTLSSANGSETTSETQKRNLGFIKVEPNLNYKLVFDTKDLLPNGKKPCMVVLYDNNYNFIKAIYDEVDTSKFFTTSNCVYIRFRVPNDATNIVFSKFSSSIVDYKQDKKPILFKDADNTWKPVTELRGINSSLCDTVESSKYNKKLDEIVLDETLNYTLWKPNPNAVNTIMFSLPNLKIKRGSQYSPISNLLVNRIGVPKEPISSFKDLDKEGIGYWDSSISLFVSINKSQLETPDAEGFKKLLKKWNDEGQPLKVIYEKEVYEQYEVNPLDLQSFENETMLLFKYGIVNGTSEFYIDSNLGSITLENMERLSRIENEIYQVKKIVLNGDYRTMAQSTYPEDFKEVVKYE